MQQRLLRNRRRHNVNAFDGECCLFRHIRLLVRGVLPLRQQEAARTPHVHKFPHTKVVPLSPAIQWCDMARVVSLSSVLGSSQVTGIALTRRQRFAPAFGRAHHAARPQGLVAIEAQPNQLVQ